jgi:hypothetical protein
MMSRVNAEDDEAPGRVRTVSWQEATTVVWRRGVSSDESTEAEDSNP